MPHKNIEIKTRCGNPEKIRKILASKKADYRGEDCQTDVYFDIPHGRLKWRKGLIENSLIYYERKNIRGPKQSNVILYNNPNAAVIKAIRKTLAELVTVRKKREIYFIGNVKFHIDNVKNLGRFIEIEAMDKEGTMPEKRLLRQCNYYIKLFDIKKNDLVYGSYNNLLLEN
jgi:adenylate cyclase class 2